jgi:hypothetical protein
MADGSDDDGEVLSLHAPASSVAATAEVAVQRVIRFIGALLALAGSYPAPQTAGGRDAAP